MHINGMSPYGYAANLYAAGNDPRTVAAQRAADTRKKLLNAGQAAGEGATPEETVLISGWNAAASAQPQAQPQSQSHVQSVNHPYASYPPRDLGFD